MTTVAWNATLRRASARIRNNMQHVPHADRADALYEAVTLWLTRGLSSPQAGASTLSQEGILALSNQNASILSVSEIAMSSGSQATLLSQQTDTMPLAPTVQSASDPAPWLVFVARRLLINRWKATRREVLFSSLGGVDDNDNEESNEFGSGENCALAWEIRHDYARALEAMSDTLRECFTLYLDGYTIIEIATRLGLSPEAAKKRTQRARIFMQEYLHEYAA